MLLVKVKDQEDTAIRKDGHCILLHVGLESQRDQLVFLISSRLSLVQLY